MAYKNKCQQEFTYLFLSRSKIFQVPNGNSTVWRNIEPRLRGEEAPDLSLRAELGLEAGREDILGLLSLDHRHVLIHRVFKNNYRFPFRRIEISEGSNQISFVVLKTLLKVPMTR